MLKRTPPRLPHRRVDHQIPDLRLVRVEAGPDMQHDRYAIQQRPHVAPVVEVCLHDARARVLRRKPPARRRAMHHQAQLLPAPGEERQQARGLLAAGAGDQQEVVLRISWHGVRACVRAVRAASRLGLDYVVNHKADGSKSGYAEKVSRRRSF